MIFPINIGNFQRWAIRQLYYKLYPYIKDDFMGRRDCQMVHQEGNMMAGQYPVTYTAFRGGSSMIASIKQAEYEARAQSGEIEVDVAEETGTFTGV